MIAYEDPEFTALDAYIRSQLAEAAETYTSQTDVDSRLRAVLQAGSDDKPHL
jgi:hypothetical protein